MRRGRSKLRQVLKWMALAVCIGVAGAGVLTVRYHFGFVGTWSFITDCGVFAFGRRETFSFGGWYFGRAPEYDAAYTLMLLARLPRLSLSPLGFAIPAWLLSALVAIPTAWLWHRDRRPPPGFCQTCGYNLTGNTSGVCPECGERT